tara:strand:- start:287 stop:1207 length:921 start_codon:yes stop_codon:yes gene_type:complete
MKEEKQNLQDEYTLNIFSKIKHKKWELYVITRIIHSLDDPEIEFVCQQHVTTSDNKRFLMDLCFPQLELYCEIDEGQHSSEEHKIEDKNRKDEIIDATDWSEKRIKVYEEDNSTLRFKKLIDLNKEIEDFVKFIKNRKKEYLLNDDFLPWDIEKKYDPETYIKRGFLDTRDNVSFLVQKDAKKCYGYDGGHTQNSIWRIKGTSIWLWFPKLYENAEWSNSLSKDLKMIEMKKNDDSILPDIKEHQNSNYVFAHQKTPLGKFVYKFIGHFCISREESNLYRQVYRRENTRVPVSPIPSRHTNYERKN